MQRTTASERREQRAAITALACAFVAALLVAGAAAIWDQPDSWIPIPAGFASGVIAYAFLA